MLSGFSGAGKGTLMKRLFELHGEEYALSVSATTRKPREGEEEGKAYFFKTNEEFEKMIREDAFLEYAGYCDHYYGTPRAYVEEQREKRPDTLLLFVTPPDGDELKKRLTGRGTETQDVIEARLSRASEEAEGVEVYDYLLINDELDTCVEELHEIIRSEHRRMTRQQNIEKIAKIREELQKFRKGEK